MNVKEFIANYNYITKNYIIQLSNLRQYPYRLGFDKLISKITIYKNNQLLNIKDVQIDIYFNITGNWIKYDEIKTNRFGIAIHTYPTDLFPEVTNCLGAAIVHIDDEMYISNIVRYNFIEGEIIIFNIDAQGGLVSTLNVRNIDIIERTEPYDLILDADDGDVLVDRNEFDFIYESIFVPSVNRSDYIIVDALSSRLIKIDRMKI